MKLFYCLKAGWIVCVLFLLSSPALSADSLVIIDNNKSDWRIVPLSADRQIQFATGELKKYLGQISDAELAIERKQRPSHNILVGLREDVPEKYRHGLQKKTGYDGYAIFILENPAVIIIAGDNRQGVIYGVYDFLERLGCRWFYPVQDPRDVEVVPKLERVLISEGAWAVASPIRNRVANGSAWYFDSDYNNAIRQLDWAMKNRYNMVGWQAAASNSRRSLLQQYKDLEDAGVIAELQKRGMTIHGPAHSFDQLLNSADYFEEHPEWFGMRNGKRVPQSFIGSQFCWSNREARNQFITNAENFITQAPQIKIFCTIPFDGGSGCDCDECKKQGSSNLLMILSGELIERLKISRPDVLVETIGGYGPVEGPPSDLSVIHEKQRIIWAQWGRYHGVGYDDPEYDKSNLESWRKAAKGGLIICQYYTDNFAEPWIMGPFTKAIESDRRYFMKNKIEDLYMLMWAPGYWWNHTLNGYIAGRSFYDTSLSPQNIIRDYAVHYYGEKAGPLLSEYYMEWANNIDLSYHLRNSETTKEDGEMLNRERKELIDPAVLASANDKLYSYRVSKVEKLHTLGEMLWQSYDLRHTVQDLRKEGRFRKAAKFLEKSRIQTDQVMKKFYELANLNQGLIDKNEVPGFIHSSIKNWIDEEAKLISSKERSAK